MLTERRCPANAAQLQDVWGVNGTGGHDDLTARRQLRSKPLAKLAGGGELDTAGVLLAGCRALKCDAGGACPCEDLMGQGIMTSAEDAPQKSKHHIRMLLSSGSLVQWQTLATHLEVAPLHGGLEVHAVHVGTLPLVLRHLELAVALLKM